MLRWQAAGPGAQRPCAGQAGAQASSAWLTVTVPPAIGLPFLSRTRRVTAAGIALAAMLWLVPETSARVAYSGREPKTSKIAQVPVPLMQAFVVAVWPSASGPGVSVAEAIPLALAEAEPLGATIPVELCQVTGWPAAGFPPPRAGAWTGHCAVAPAAG